MNVTLLALLSLSAYIFGQGVLGYARKVWRPPVLTTETNKWAEHCRDSNGKSCDDFAGCCKSFPEMAKCTESGGILEHPICNYWLGIQFNAKDHGKCGCFEKFIKADYKSQCQGEVEKQNCNQFVGCCLMADDGWCDSFVSGELEHPACDALAGKSFNYNQAVCHCATESSNPTLKPNVSMPTFPNATRPIFPTNITTRSSLPANMTTRPTFPNVRTSAPAPAVRHKTDSGGDKNDGSSGWITALVTLLTAIIHRRHQPAV